MDDPIVAVLMGSNSDYRIMSAACEQLTEFGIPHEARIVSAHRTPDLLYDYAKSAESKGFEVIIAGAGGSAHLPGMVAALTPLPVIGVPIQQASPERQWGLEGLDAILSILQMPKGVVVATVAINNAANAALLAAQILSVKNKELRKAVKEFRAQQTKKVLSMTIGKD